MPPCPLIAERTVLSSPSLSRGIQASRSPIFGAPLTPLSWHLEHWVVTISSPLRGAAFVRLSTGSVHFPPDWLTMVVTARLISMSERLILPPCEGIWRMPWSAWSVRLERPCDARLLQACLSPIFGAPLAPEAWHLEQTASTTSLPLRSVAWASAPCGDTAATKRRSAADLMD